MHFRKHLILFIPWVLIFNHCAYFNTFYNAKRYYRRAQYETKRNRTDKVTGSEKTNYGKAIEKSYRLIEFYPKSKYVDDAILMLGKSYYYQKEYLQANRKFLELEAEKPESELVPDARLWLAKTELALKQIPQAERRLNQLMQNRLPGRLRGDAYFAMGLIYEAKRDHEEAVNAFKRALDEGMEEMQEEALFAIGADLDSLGRFKEAAEYFKRVLNMNILEQMRFDASVRHARMLKKMGEVDKAIQEFETLLADVLNKKRFPDVMLEIGESLVQKGDIEGAIITYDDITKEYKKTPQSARAFFELGKVYEEHRNDYDRSISNYDQVKIQYARSEYADTALVLVRDIRRFRALEEVIQMGMRGEEGELVLETEETEEDSLTLDKMYAWMGDAARDSARSDLLVLLGGKVFADSIHRERILLEREEQRTGREVDSNARRDKQSIDWVAWLRKGEMPSFTRVEEVWSGLQVRADRERKTLVENPELKTFNVDEIDKNYLLLAELYLLRFLQPDSAVKQYSLLLENFPESPHAAQALHNLAYIYGEIESEQGLADSVFEELIRRFPKSSYANIGRERLGLPHAYTREDSARNLFAMAESALLDNEDPFSAFSQYRELSELYSESAWAPKALYSMAWISENHWDSLDLALALYDTLMKRYPESVYAEGVKEKVTTVRTQTSLADEVQPDDMQQKEGTASDSVLATTQRPDSSESLTAAETDSLISDTREKRRALDEEEDSNRSASLVGNLEELRERVVFPVNIEKEAIADIVFIQVEVDTLGIAGDIRIRRSSGHAALDATCIEAVRQSRFHPAMKNGTPQPSTFIIRLPLFQELRDTEAKREPQG